VPHDAASSGASSTRVNASPATDASAALLSELISLGLRHIIVSPGSRSQALALLAAEFERRGDVQLHVRIDERVAGFLALGIGRESRMPAAVICTSGTAAANLLPAALEAHHSGVPLILLTADRPPELRGIGANQTTDQLGMFAGLADAGRLVAIDVPVPTDVDDDGLGVQSARSRAWARRAWDAATGSRRALATAGPVQLNLGLREPLAGALPTWLGAPTAPDGSPWPIEALDLPEEPRAHLTLARGPRTVVLAGAGAGPAAEQLAHEGGWPLVAEILSGARFGRNVVHGYRALLNDPALGGQIERVVVFGHPTLSRETAALISRADTEVIAVTCTGEPLNLNKATAHVDAVTVADGETDREWFGAWMRASQAAAVDLSPPPPDVEGLHSTDHAERLRAVAAELDVVRLELDRVGLVDAIWRATWPHDRLLFGSSRIVRIADEVLPGKAVVVHSNRGLAGIDGTIATGMGIAAASQIDGQAGVTRVLLGDLTLLHDVGAMLLPPVEAAPRIQVIVGNDGGGTIFDDLEVAATASADDMTRVQYTPQDVDLEQLARAYGWEYHRVTTRSALDQVLTTAVGGRQLIEVPLAR
jgi:2-succinyl-5-enolpyruvyl-6-hydroxy-3-cyclohexene-1-carboxylate synthase